MFNRLDKERFCLCPPTKLLTNNLLNSWNEVMVFGCSLLNHTLPGPFKVVGKALHMISSRTLWRSMVVLNVAIWSQGSRVPSYEPRIGILNLEGKGWLVMDVINGESVLWTRSSIWFTLLIESFIFSMTIFIWSISLSKCSTFQATMPLNWSPSALLSAPSFSKFWPRSPPCYWWHCLLTSLVNSWFYCVSFAMATAMDCNCCWMVKGGGGAWFGWLEAFPLS